MSMLTRDGTAEPVPLDQIQLTTRRIDHLFTYSACVLSSYLFWTSDLLTHQPGSHRKVAQDFSTFLQRCLP